eukprot:768716-Hanusia_phi.AAC.9
MRPVLLLLPPLTSRRLCLRRKSEVLHPPLQPENLSSVFTSHSLSQPSPRPCHHQWTWSLCTIQQSAMHGITCTLLCYWESLHALLHSLSGEEPPWC